MLSGETRLGSLPCGLENTRTSVLFPCLVPDQFSKYTYKVNLESLKYIQSEVLKFSCIIVIVFTSWNKTGIKRHVFLNVSLVAVNNLEQV